MRVHAQCEINPFLRLSETKRRHSYSACPDLVFTGAYTDQLELICPNSLFVGSVLHAQLLATQTRRRPVDVERARKSGVSHQYP